MNKKLTGFKHVFKFTLIQSLKSKSYIISTCVLCIMALLSMPVTSLISKNESKVESFSFNKVLILDDAACLSNDFTEMLNINEAYKDVEFVADNREMYKIINEVENNGDEKSIFLYLTHDLDTYSFKLEVYYNGNGLVKRADVNVFSNDIETYFKKMLPIFFDVTDEQLEVINAPVLKEVNLFDEDGNVIKDKERIDMTEYYVMLGFLVAVLMIVQIVATTVSSSIVQEKSSKVIEFLLTNVNPFAILSGKIVASLCTVFVEVLAIGISYIGSLAINGLLSDSKEIIPVAVKNAIESGIFKDTNLLGIFIAVITIFLGFIFYGTTSSLAGATVSRIEDMAEGQKMQSIVVVIGAYLGMFYVISLLQGGGSEILKYIAFLLPISSVFILPVFAILGKVTLSLAIVSLVVLVISVIILTQFASNIYAALLYYTGNPMKIKEFIAFSKIHGKAGK